MAGFEVSADGRFSGVHRGGGVVNYEAGELAFFPEITFVPPDIYNVACREIHDNIRNGTFELKGEMPSDFHQRMMNAVEKRIDWQAKRKREFLNWFRTGV